MIRAVVDTNTLVSGIISPLGAPAQIIRRWQRGDFLLLTSPALLAELRRVLEYPRIVDRLGWSGEECTQFVKGLETLALVTPGALRLPGVTRDPKDDPVVACAVEGEAGFIVSGDQDLLVLGTHKGVRVVTPREFLTLLEAQANWTNSS
ncbi:MAG: putative toxin-antitoxin system toxin component, PIN family [Anaerolineae bacterium]|nr:putative toxin-antitoxin system toxin component, PIN family [Anaerolineae bacterium]